MAVTYGFYNSLNHDRLYDAIQMSSIFDGIITDGIFSTIGTAMVVTAPGDDMFVNVGAGRAWFNHTWTLNDTEYPIEVPESEVVLSRIDALVLEIDSSVETRANTLKFVKGTPSSNPVKPTLTHTAEVNQYALAYITVGPGVTVITQSNVENAVGTDETPFITGILQQISIETLIGQWEAEFNEYFQEFESVNLNEFMDWFDHMKDQLSEDAAGHLQEEIDDINEMIGQSYETAVQQKVIGDTTAVFTDENIHTTSEIHVMYQNASESFGYTSTSTIEGSCTVTFPALTENTEIKLKVINRTS